MYFYKTNKKSKYYINDIFLKSLFTKLINFKSDSSINKYEFY